MVYVNSIKRLILKADLRREPRILFFYMTWFNYLCNMNSYIENIKKLISNNEIEEAIQALHLKLKTEPKNDEAFFLLGNAYCKLNDWQQALNAYGQALSINPQSPARIAHDRVLEIFNFYNKDIYNP